MHPLYRADVIDSRTLAEVEPSETEPDELRWFAALSGELQDYWDEVQLRDGLTLVADRHFEDYARELAEDTGMIPDDLLWPVRHIDWTAAAEELKQDYTEVDIEVDSLVDTYWVLTN